MGEKPSGEVDATLQTAQSQDVTSDPKRPSEGLSTKKQSLSDIFTIVSLPYITPQIMLIVTSSPQVLPSYQMATLITS
jgi:hypothetical protein